MRLTEFEIETIHKLAQKYFGEKSKIFLFGSRVDDKKKGGDIDLFLKSTDKRVMSIQAKINFLAELKRIIGNRKIDLVFDNQYTKLKTQFYHSIKSQYIEL